jgi:predicted regulator of Ras-like GTPase activity (Roadblock/LC7/MglB family)
MAASLANVLHELQAANGLKLAAVVSADGLVIDAATHGEVDAESIGSVASNGMLVMEALGQELGEDHPEMMTLEYGRHIVLISPLGSEHLLVLLADAGTNLGRIRIVVRRRIDAVKEAVAGV